MRCAAQCDRLRSTRRLAAHAGGSLARTKLALLVLVALFAVALGLGACGGEPSFSDPASAQCTAPPVSFGRTQTSADHGEAEVHFYM